MGKGNKLILSLSSLQESQELEKFQAQYGQLSRSVQSLEPNAKLCNTERSLEEERVRLQPQLESHQSVEHSQIDKYVFLY